MGMHMVPTEPSQAAKKGEHGSLPVRAVPWRGPAGQGCSHVSLAAPRARAGGSNCRFSSSPIPCVGHICEQQHIWVHSQPAPHVPFPHKGQPDEAGGYHMKRGQGPGIPFQLLSW